MGKIIVVGTLAFDTIETPFGKVERVLGGSAPFASLAAKTQDVECAIISIVGNDFPKSYLDLFVSKEIDISEVQIEKSGKSFFWSGKYHENMNKRDTLETQVNVLSDFDPKLPLKFLDTDVLVLGNLDPKVQLSVLNQFDDSPHFIMLDTMNFWMDNNLEDLNEVISKVNLISINDEEAYLLAKEKSLDGCAHKIIKKGPKYVIIKKGELGAELHSKDEKFSMPSFRTEAVDPTGAGDSFAGGVATYLSKTNSIDFNSIKKGLILGTILASFTVEGLGTKSIEKVVKKKILDRLEKFIIKNKFDLNLSI